MLFAMQDDSDLPPHVVAQAEPAAHASVLAPGALGAAIAAVAIDGRGIPLDLKLIDDRPCTIVSHIIKCESAAEHSTSALFRILEPIGSRGHPSGSSHRHRSNCN